MPLRSFRFNLSGYLHYYGHIRLPRQRPDSSAPLGSPTFMRYLRTARNIILPRVPVGLSIAVTSTNIAGFIQFGRLTGTTSITRPD